MEAQRPRDRAESHKIYVTLNSQLGSKLISIDHIHLNPVDIHTYIHTYIHDMHEYIYIYIYIYIITPHHDSHFWGSFEVPPVGPCRWRMKLLLSRSKAQRFETFGAQGCLNYGIFLIMGKILHYPQ